MNILLILILASTHAFDILEQWTPRFQKQVLIKCSAGENVCFDLCKNNDRCAVAEEPCKNCIGTSVMINHIFLDVGTVLTYGEEITDHEIFANFLKAGQFAAFSRRSISDSIHNFNSEELRDKFAAICPQWDYIRDPMIFYRTEKVTRRLVKPEYITCPIDGGSTLLFSVNEAGNTVVHHSLLMLNKLD